MNTSLQHIPPLSHNLHSAAVLDTREKTVPQAHKVLQGGRDLKAHQESGVLWATPDLQAHKGLQVTRGGQAARAPQDPQGGQEYCEAIAFCPDHSFIISGGCAGYPEQPGSGNGHVYPIIPLTQVATVAAHSDTEYHGLGDGGYQKCAICGQKGQYVQAEAYCCNAAAVPDRYYPGPIDNGHHDPDTDTKGTKFGGRKNRQQEQQTRAAELGDPAAAGTVDGVHSHSVDDLEESAGRQVSSNPLKVEEAAAEVPGQAIAAEGIAVNLSARVGPVGVGKPSVNNGDAPVLGDASLLGWKKLRI
eukprot:gene9770-9927_t